MRLGIPRALHQVSDQVLLAAVLVVVAALMLTTCGPTGGGELASGAPLGLAGTVASDDPAVLAPEAASAVRTRAMARSDTDGDGKVDPSELDAFFAALAAAEDDAPAAPMPSVPRVVPARSVVLPPVDTDDPRLFLVGDSVLEASAPTIEAMLPSWEVTADTRVGRRVPEGAGVIEARRDEIGEVAVIVLGHNYALGEGFAAQYSRIMRQLWSLDRVVWVTVAEWSPGQREVNALIRQNAEIWPNVVVADWAQLAAANPGYLARDGVHLTGAGVVALADLAARAVGAGPRPGGVVSVEVPVAPGGSATPTGSPTSSRPLVTVSVPTSTSTTTVPSSTGSTTTSAPTTAPTSTEPTSTLPTSTAPTSTLPTSTAPTSTVPDTTVLEAAASP